MNTDRSPLRWCLPLFLLPFAALGVGQILRTAPVRRLEGTIPPPEDPAFHDTVRAILGTPLQRGSRIELMQNGDGVFGSMWRDIESARSSVAVHAYFWSEGEVAAKLVRLLTDRARAGVSVRLLYDRVGAIGHPPSAFDELRAAGAEVVSLRPLAPRSWHAVHHRSHARYVLVDERVAYTGGFGFADQWAGSGRRGGEWRDTAVRVEGPLAHVLGSGFRALWAEACGTLIAGVSEPSPPNPAVGDRGAEALALQSSPTSISSPTERLFALSIGTARRRLYLAIAYFVPNRFFIGLLSDAVARGVDVRVLTANRRSDIPPAWWAGRARYEELLRSGVRIYEYEPSMMHAKTWVADGRWSIVGAANLDNQSLTNLDESMVGVLDEELGGELERAFLADLELANEIRLDAFRRRPIRHRVLERVASSVSRLL